MYPIPQSSNSLHQILFKIAGRCKIGQTDLHTLLGLFWYNKELIFQAYQSNTLQEARQNHCTVK